VWTFCPSELNLVLELSKEKVKWSEPLSGVKVRAQNNEKFLVMYPTKAEDQETD
jgi:hypothetical protein